MESSYRIYNSKIYYIEENTTCCPFNIVHLLTVLESYSWFNLTDFTYLSICTYSVWGIFIQPDHNGKPELFSEYKLNNNI